MEASEVKKCIEQGIPGAEATVTSDGSKYTAVVVSPEFDGKTMIAVIQKMAHDSGAVDRSFAHRLEKAEKIIYTRFLREIDDLFGCIRPNPIETGAGVKPVATCV